MTLNLKAPRILPLTLLITAASTLAGCASTPLTESRSAQNTGTSQDISDSIVETRPSADDCRVWRDAFLDPARVSVNIFSLFGLPVMLVRDANCPQ